MNKKRTGLVIEKNGTNPWKVRKSEHYIYKKLHTQVWRTETLYIWENRHINDTNKKNFFTCPISLTRSHRLPKNCDATAVNGLLGKPVLNSEGVRSVRKCRHLFDCLRWNCWTSFLVGVSDFFSYLFYKALYICIGGIWYYDRYRKKDMLNFGHRILPHSEYGSGRTLGWGGGGGERPRVGMAHW